jgi:protein SCO1
MTLVKVFRFAAWGTLAGLVLALALVWTGAVRLDPLLPGEPRAEIGGPFSLTDQHGNTRSWDDFRGKATAVFFGFTHCPDICPTTLWELSERMKDLGPRSNGLNVILISVDPERDTPEILKRYLQSFDPRIVALTGTDPEVAKAVSAFKAYRKKIPSEDGNYTMDHTSLVYLFDGNGAFVTTLDRHEKPEIQAKKIDRVL